MNSNNIGILYSTFMLANLIMDRIKISNDQDSFLQWKIFCDQVNVSDKFVEMIQKTCSDFIHKFFSIPKGETEKLKLESSRVVNSLRNYIPNFNSCERSLEKLSEEIFNNYFFLADELRLEKSKKLISNFTQKYEVIEEYKIIFKNEQNIKDKKQKFLTEILELEKFEAKKIYNLFGHYFLKGFSSADVENCKNECFKLEEVVNDRMARLMSKTKSQIEEFFSGIIERKYCILYLKSTQIHPVPIKHDWKTSFYGSFELENYELRQIFILHDRIYIAVVSFNNSRNNIMILITPSGSTIIKNSNLDHRAVIVSGSSIDQLIVYLNTSSSLIKGYLSKNMEFVHSEKFDLQNFPGSISSAAILKPEKEIFLLKDNGELFCFSLKNQKRNIEHLKHYKYNKVESVGNLLIFFNSVEIVFIDKKLDRVYKENNGYCYCCLIEKSVTFLNFDGMNEVRFNKVEILDEHLKEYNFFAYFYPEPSFNFIQEYFENLRLESKYLTEHFFVTKRRD